MACAASVRALALANASHTPGAPWCHDAGTVSICKAASVETNPRSASQSATSRATTRSSDAVKDFALRSPRTACNDNRRKRAMSDPKVPLRASARPNDLEMPSVASGAAPGRGGVIALAV